MSRSTPARLLAVIAASALLAGPALAKNGGDGHDNGRHLGWYKNGGPGPGMFPGAPPYMLERDQFGGTGYTRGWVGRDAWGGGAWGWQTGVISAGLAWGAAWGVGTGFFAPPVVFVPPPTYVSLPPVVFGVPWMEAPAPYYPPAYASRTVSQGFVETPESMLWAAVPPPVFVLPPQDVMRVAGPPPIIFSPPAYALSVWPVLAFAPPMLAVAVMHDDWWTTSYQNRGGYYAGSYYASQSYAGGIYAPYAVATGFVDQGYARRGFAPDLFQIAPGFAPGFDRGRGDGRDDDRNDGGRRGKGKGEGHGRGH